MATTTIPAATTTEVDIGQPAVEQEEFVYKKVVYKDFVRKKKYIPWWILGFVGIVVAILITVYHDQIVKFMRPTSEKIREIPGGFVIPVAILVLISFPPLFGHEIVALLCGVVYGLWIGFAIVAAGTFIGEIGTWFAFKYAFRRKAEKLERTNLNYGSLARLTRDGGFWVVLIIRFSVIPSHLSTAVFSTSNVNFYYFAIATFLTLPKQIVIVYFGVLLAQETKSNFINTIVLGITFIVTVVAGVYIYTKMRATKKILMEEQAARLDAKANLNSTSGSTTSQEQFIQQQVYSRNDFPVNTRETYIVPSQPALSPMNFSQPDRGLYSQQPPPPSAEWQEAGGIEMHENRRPTKAQEFL